MCERHTTQRFASGANLCNMGCHVQINYLQRWPMPLTAVLISTYELGRQSFAIASAAAWLRQAGATVTCLDLAIAALPAKPIAAADLVAFHLPMHTATRTAAAVVGRVRQINPRAHLCFFGLYAPVNESYLRALGADSILGGEFEADLAALARRLASGDTSPAPEAIGKGARPAFLVPERGGMPPLDQYAHLDWGDGRASVTGYTEASRGCKHLCRHCPVVPVYHGRFHVVPREIVRADIANQVAAGARHITFGDPDFFNGPGHALPLVRELHRQFPGVTYDVTIKVEHLLKHAEHLPALKETNCALVTSAVEAVDDHILAIFDKGHTRADFARAVALLRENELALNPTFVAFNPWITLDGYRDLLGVLAEFELVEHVAPIQLAIRLLIPAGSRLLELPEVRQLAGPFDAAALIHPWAHPNPRVDHLQGEVLSAVKAGEANGDSRAEIFARVWQLAHADGGAEVTRARATGYALASRPIPRLSEPWYC